MDTKFETGDYVTIADVDVDGLSGRGIEATPTQGESGEIVGEGRGEEGFQMYYVKCDGGRIVEAADFELCA